MSGDVAEGARIIQAGGLVAFPTETVYGLGADALNPAAVARIFAAKERPTFDPLIMHVASADWLTDLVTDIPPLARALAGHFWPGPLTLLLPKRERVPDLVTAGLPHVGVRVPAHPLALALLKAAGRPIAAPSANLFGRVSPTTAAHVAAQLKDRVDLILDGGPCRVGVESTVVLVADDQIEILRPGGVTAEEIAAATGISPTHREQTVLDTASQVSPGLLAQHYAPRTPLVIAENWREVSPAVAATAGALAFQPAAESDRFQTVEVLSRAGDLGEAAAGFFAALRRLDDSGVRLIVALPFPQTGLGVALNDRLRRAATH